ncbi:pyridoxal phosphate-dependent aminotransferase [Terrilactibacillus laevilacticus]|uniref:Aminotransferase n=1 Tax=Terrilactibacillus laevilacticus TaxID=1380157 RepID=A0ABW5PUK2_9BACI|nr:pyridoxal phosphate-dependent aminotransferase [Terrilactibacillus laevilacticus]
MSTTSRRLDTVGFSTIRKVYEKTNQLRDKGLDIYSLIIGEPDFSTPKVITQTLINSISNNQTHYTSNYGLTELREAIAHKLQSENKILASPNEVLITVGATEAVYVSVTGILNPGDEAIIPQPCWPYYEACCKLAGATPIPIPLRLKNDAFTLSVEDLEKQITPNTRLLVLNSPNNPTGMVLDLDTLKEIAQLAIKYDLTVISDEIYEKIIYDDQTHISIASLPGMSERTITINGFSKAYAMTGWRIGYIHAPIPLLKGFVKLHQYNVTCLPEFTQRAAVVALEQAAPDVKLMRNEFNRRRNLVVHMLSQSKALEIPNPKGAFYLFVNIEKCGMTSNQLAMEILEETGVAVVPGSSFGKYGEGFIRLSYAATDTILKEACNRLVKYVDSKIAIKHD